MIYTVALMDQLNDRDIHLVSINIFDASLAKKVCSEHAYSIRSLVKQAAHDFMGTPRGWAAFRDVGMFSWNGFISGVQEGTCARYGFRIIGHSCLDFGKVEGFPDKPSYEPYFSLTGIGRDAEEKNAGLPDPCEVPFRELLQEGDELCGADPDELSGRLRKYMSDKYNYAGLFNVTGING